MEHIEKPGIVTISLSKEKLLSLISKNEKEIEIYLKPHNGLYYDLSTIQLLCGLKAGFSNTEFFLDEDISNGIQFTINTIPIVDLTDEFSKKISLSVIINSVEY